MNITNYIIPIVIGGILIIGLIKGVDVFTEFLEGAKENLSVGIQILPALMALMVAVGMFKASGAMDILTYAISPLTNLLGFPSECVPLAIIRPISGSGALAVYENILTSNHPDSLVGRVASVMLGSTETTFYTISVYFSVTKIQKTRHTLFCALLADLAGFMVSSIVVRHLFS